MKLCFVLLILSGSFGVVSSVYGADDDYRLGGGDRIKVIVFGQADLSGEFEISATGRVALPLIQEVQADGLTTRELEEAIIQKLKPDYLKDPKVSVEVVKFRPFFILGEVRSPGSYPYVSGMTVVTAVALAGGYTYRAKTAQAYITRENDPAKKKQLVEPNARVHPGDVIVVPERFF
ncbi:MAG: polysaccharide biosynthesis/export family protein [Gammaproteobacteria bacterium]